MSEPDKKQELYTVFVVKGQLKYQQWDLLKAAGALHVVTESVDLSKIQFVRSF